MSPAEALASYQRVMSRVGETVYHRRYSGTAPSRTYVDTPTTARVVNFDPKELIGPIVQGDIKVIAMADELSAVLPITTNDKIVIRGRPCAIKAIDDNTRRVQGTLIAFDFLVST